MLTMGQRWRRTINARKAAEAKRKKEEAAKQAREISQPIIEGIADVVNRAEESGEDSVLIGTVDSKDIIPIQPKDRCELKAKDLRGAARIIQRHCAKHDLVLLFGGHFLKEPRVGQETEVKLFVRPKK